ncbi:hypothetical protein VPH35_131241 [Triticum aestivum]
MSMVLCTCVKPFYNIALSRSTQLREVLAFPHLPLDVHLLILCIFSSTSGDSSGHLSVHFLFILQVKELPLGSSCRFCSNLGHLGRSTTPLEHVQLVAFQLATQSCGHLMTLSTFETCETVAFQCYRLVAQDALCFGDLQSDYLRAVLDFLITAWNFSKNPS